MAHAQPRQSTGKPTNDWRTKYYEVVELQKRQQRDFEQESEQLQRALVQLSQAATGSETELDHVLAALQEHLKTPAKQHQLYKRLAVVEGALQAFAERKQQFQTQIAANTGTLLKTFLQTNHNRDHTKTCKQLESQLKLAPPTQQLLLQTLVQLAQMQSALLVKGEKEKPGLMQKLLAGAGHGENASPQDHRAICAALQDITGLLHTHIDEEATLSNINQQLQTDLSNDQIAAIIISLSECIATALTQSEQEFSQFLSNTNQQLQTINAILNDAALVAGQQNDQHQRLCVDMDEQLQSLQTTVEQAVDLRELKAAVDQQLAGIRNKLTQSKQTQSKQSPSLSAQLQSVLQQVEQFEKQARVTSKSLHLQRQKALHDALTGLPNREAYQQRWELERARYQRNGQALCLAVIDVDFFKRINDNYGHQAGDKVLRLIAQTLQKQLRATDFIGRYGGEEFVVLLPDTPLDAAVKVVEKLGAKVAATPFHFRKQPVQITVSIGIASIKAEDSQTTLFERADKAMYLAKEQGRNRVVSED